MAFVVKDLDENEKKKAATSAQQPTQIGPGAAGATITPSAPTSGATPVKPEGQRQSGRFTDLRRYLEANQGQGAKLADDVSRSIETEGSGLKTDIESGQKEFTRQANEESNKYFTDQDVNTTRKFIQQAETLEGSDDQKRIQELGAAAYGGPVDIDINTWADRLAKVKARSDRLKTEQGRFEELRGVYNDPQYKQGARRLDQLLLSSQPEVNERFEQLRQGIQTNLEGQPEKVRSEAQALAESRKQAIDAARAAYLQKFGYNAGDVAQRQVERKVIDPTQLQVQPNAQAVPEYKAPNQFFSEQYNQERQAAAAQELANSKKAYEDSIKARKDPNAKKIPEHLVLRLAPQPGDIGAGTNTPLVRSPEMVSEIENAIKTRHELLNKEAKDNFRQAMTGMVGKGSITAQENKELYNLISGKDDKNGYVNWSLYGMDPTSDKYMTFPTEATLGQVTSPTEGKRLDTIARTFGKENSALLKGQEATGDYKTGVQFNREQFKKDMLDKVTNFRSEVAPLINQMNANSGKNAEALIKRFSDEAQRYYPNPIDNPQAFSNRNYGYQGSANDINTWAQYYDTARRAGHPYDYKGQGVASYRQGSSKEAKRFNQLQTELDRLGNRGFRANQIASSPEYQQLLQKAWMHGAIKGFNETKNALTKMHVTKRMEPQRKAWADAFVAFNAMKKKYGFPVQSGGQDFNKWFNNDVNNLSINTGDKEVGQYSADAVNRMFGAANTNFEYKPNSPEGSSNVTHSRVFY